jgi:phosphate transport system substrate-binding protein
LSAPLRRRDIGAALLALGGRAFAQVAKAPGDLPGYARIDKLAGAVSGAGSSTVASVLKQVGDGFQQAQPEIGVELSGAGSGTALAGLLASPTTMGLLSRALTQRERDAVRAQYGHAPTEVKIAIDAVAVFVFKGNPVKSLSLADLRRAFGREADAANRWGALGLGGEWADMPISRFGLERGRGAYDLFREVVLEGGEFAAEIEAEPVSTSVVQGVATRAGGIGFASVFFRTQRTRALAIEHKGQLLEPTLDNALSGRYPLARFLYVVVNKKPDAPLDPAQRQFLAYVLSRDGQDVIARQGLFPLDAKVAAEQVALLGGAATK